MSKQKMTWNTQIIFCPYCNQLSTIIYQSNRKDSTDYVLRCEKCKRIFMRNVKVYKKKNFYESIIVDIERGSLKWKELMYWVRY